MILLWFLNFVCTWGQGTALFYCHLSSGTFLVSVETQMNPLGLGKDMKICGGSAVFSGEINVWGHLLFVTLEGWRDQCHLGTPARCWAVISPLSQAVPVLLYPFHQRFFSCYISWIAAGWACSTQLWELSGSLSLQQPFMHFTLALFLSFFLRFTLMSSEARPLPRLVSLYPIYKWCLYFLM